MQPRGHVDKRVVTQRDHKDEIDGTDRTQTQGDRCEMKTKKMTNEQKTDLPPRRAEVVASDSHSGCSDGAVGFDGLCSEELERDAVRCFAHNVGRPCRCERKHYWLAGLLR